MSKSDTGSCEKRKGDPLVLIPEPDNMEKAARFIRMNFRQPFYKYSFVDSVCLHLRETNLFFILFLNQSTANFYFMDLNSFRRQPQLDGMVFPFQEICVESRFYLID